MEFSSALLEARAMIRDSEARVIYSKKYNRLLGKCLATFNPDKKY